MALSAAYCVHLTVAGPSAGLPDDLRPMLEAVGDAARVIQRQLGTGPASLLHQLTGLWKSRARRSSFKEVTGSQLVASYTLKGLAVRLGVSKRQTVAAYARALEGAGVLVKGRRERVAGALDRGTAYELRLEALLALVSAECSKRTASKAKAKSAISRPVSVSEKRTPQGQDYAALSEIVPPTAAAVADQLKRAGMASPSGFEKRLVALMRQKGQTVKGLKACLEAMQQQAPRQVKISLAAILYGRMAGSSYLGSEWYEQTVARAENRSRMALESTKRREDRQRVEAAEKEAQAGAWGRLCDWWSSLAETTRQEWLGKVEAAAPFVNLSSPEQVLGVVCHLRGGAC